MRIGNRWIASLMNEKNIVHPIMERYFDYNYSLFEIISSHARTLYTAHLFTYEKSVWIQNN